MLDMEARVAVLEAERDHLKDMQAATFKKLDEQSASISELIKQITQLLTLEAAVSKIELENKERIDRVEKSNTAKIKNLMMFVKLSTITNCLAGIVLVWKIVT